ncbi:hypothetical protein T08_1292 [Trichinella sp. T8]|nr:hypothetical protein T08_4958 [Trichinella sp. T8]KRZ81730.1 hypothetical protein T08_1292 [Trichinella sp. T8]
MAETQQSSYPEFPEKRDLLQPRMVVDVSNYPIPLEQKLPRARLRLLPSCPLSEPIVDLDLRRPDL